MSRSAESLRAEESYRDLKAGLRPLAKARLSLAHAFDRLMHDHWLRGEEAYSNVAIARACGVDEKTVRQWRTGEKHLPASALVMLPSELYAEVLDIVSASRGLQPKRALVQMRKALSDLRGQLAHEDKAEVTRALLDAQGQIAEILKVVLEGR